MEPDRWLGVEIRHLLALQAVAREGSFARAAVTLGYTQSAISQQIATLERLVGERLLERQAGPRAAAAPTEAGRLLLGHADAIVARLAAAQADLTAYAEGEAGLLRIGIYQSIGERILPELMRRFAAAWPRVDVALTESASDEELLRLVEAGALDLTFADLPLVEGPFESVELLRDPWLLVVPANSPLARKQIAPTAAEISELDLIGFRQCRSARIVEDVVRRPLHYVFRSDNNGTVQGLVAAGVGAALLPSLAIDENDAATRRIALGPKFPARLIALAWHRDRYRTASARAFVDAAREICAELELESAAA